jgi:hypothetical protein
VDTEICGGKEGSDVKISWRKAFAVLFAGAVFAATVGPAYAEPSPPTNGGNGGGQSGQCTGPQDDRPASCKSQGGPGG